MRHLACVLLLLAACKKSEPAKSADPAPAPTATASGAPPTAAAEPAPAPLPAPPPPAAKDPHDAAVEAAIDVLNAIAPITDKHREDGKDCATKGIPEVDTVLETKQAQLAAIHEILETKETASRFFATFIKQDESPLAEARSAALGPTLHCPELADHINVKLGLATPKPAKPAKKK